MINFYVGVVEDYQDPLKIGRLKVRVQGVHPVSQQDTPTEDLPWAQPMHPITSAASSGIGFGGVGVVVGSEVIVMFRDPGMYQEPIVLGTLPGLYKVGEESESDFGRLATNTKIVETIIQTKKDSVQTASGGEVSFAEPETAYAAIYGENSTYTTKSGHVLEFDDSTGKERIHIYHKSGTFIEMHPDGKTVVKSLGDTFEINKKTLNVYTETTKQEFIGADSKEHIGGSLNVNIIGSSVVTVGGDSTVNVGGNANLTVSGNHTTNVSGDATFTVGGNFKVTAARVDLN